MKRHVNQTFIKLTKQFKSINYITNTYSTSVVTICTPNVRYTKKYTPKQTYEVTNISGLKTTTK